MRRSALTLSLALALAACGSSTAPEEPPPSVSGTWSGTGSSGLLLYTLTLSLTESSTGRISGTGTLSAPGFDTFSLTVRNGAHGHPDVLVALFTPDHIDVNYSGRFVEDHRIEGLVNGSGFNNDPLTISRQADP